MSKKNYKYNIKNLTISVIILEIIFWLTFFLLDDYFNNSDEIIEEGKLRKIIRKAL